MASVHLAESAVMSGGTAKRTFSRTAPLGCAWLNAQNREVLSFSVVIACFYLFSDLFLLLFLVFHMKRQIQLIWSSALLPLQIAACPRAFLAYDSQARVDQSPVELSWFQPVRWGHRQKWAEVMNISFWHVTSHLRLLSRRPDRNDNISVIWQNNLEHSKLWRVSCYSWFLLMQFVPLLLSYPHSDSTVCSKVSIGSEQLAKNLIE